MARHGIRKHLKRALIGTAFAVVAFTGAVAAFYFIDTGGDARTIRGLGIDGRPAGNLTEVELDRVISELEVQVAEHQVQINLPDGPRVVSAADLGVTLNSADLRRRALEAGREGAGWERFRNWLASFTARRAIPHQLELDGTVAAGTVASFDGLVVEEPIEPKLVLDGSRSLAVMPGNPGSQVDQGAVVKRLSDQVAAGGPFRIDAPTVPLPPSTDEARLRDLATKLNVITAAGATLRLGDEVRTITPSALRVRLDFAEDGDGPNPSFDLASLQGLIEHLYGDLDLDGTDPVFDVVDDVPVLVEEGRIPLECCREDAAEAVAEAIFSDRPGPIRLEPKETEDPRKLAWARGSDIIEKVSEFTTEHPCCQARVSNIQRFADIVRGVYLVPGESLSLNEHVGERTPETGFVPAGTILRGHLVPTVGGGVSQFATTMFNAAFFAGFDFEEYQSHSIYFSRYPYGREATISWPLPDLEVTNTTDYPALIWTSYTDTSITVSIYSTKSVEVEETRQEVSAARECTRVETYRLRTYEDGRTVEDSVFATYRPAEGLDCNGNPTERPDL